jgi:hypothetical protein
MCVLSDSYTGEVGTELPKQGNNTNNKSVKSV